MRQKRAKAYRKLMHLYCQSFGFHQPYQVLIDSKTCEAAISLKIDIVKQLGSVLQGEVKPMITQCCIHELYLQGKSQQPATDLAKTFERRKCNHKEAVPGDKCLSDVVGDKNKHRYVIATQSQSLRINLRTIAATPIVHINRSVMILEPPSDVTLQTKAVAEEQLLHPTTLDKDLVTTAHAGPSPRRESRGPKGPNPLSVKRKKMVQSEIVKVGEKRKREHEAEDGSDNTSTPIQKKRKRKRKHKPSAAIE